MRQRLHLFAGTWAALIILDGCTRTYFPATPQLVSEPRVNAVAERVSIRLHAGVTVTLRTAALPGTLLRGARLVSVRAPRCETGLAFSYIEKDGALETQGPVELGGSHELELGFAEQNPPEWLKSPLTGSSALDLEIESYEGNACVRVPLGAETPEKTWKLDPTSAGLLLGAGARFFPASSTAARGAEPVAAAVLRMGGASDAARLWGEGWGGADARGDFGMWGLSAGGDRLIWSAGPWAISGGLAYDVVFSYRIAERPASLEYILHGPRLTPALTWTPFPESSKYPGFPLGRRTAYFELELPVAAWFAARGAQEFVVVPGVGLNFYLTL